MASDTTEILMLHRVLPDEPRAFGLPSSYHLRGTALTPRELDALLDGVQSVIPLEAVERALAAAEAPPPGTVLTFDDGYREHLGLVASRVMDRGVSATFYVATGLSGDGNRVAAVDAWYWLLDNARRPVGRVPMGGGEWYTRRLDTKLDKLEWIVGAPKAALLRGDSARQQRLLEALAESVGAELPSRLPRDLYLTAAEWKRLSVAPLRLGAHSVTHPRLSLLEEHELDFEVTTSIREVSNLSQVVSFAYPDGDFDPRVLARVRTLTSSAVTCEPGIVTGATRLHRLPRRFVRPQDVYAARRRASPWSHHSGRASRG